MIPPAIFTRSGGLLGRLGLFGRARGSLSVADPRSTHGVKDAIIPRMSGLQPGKNMSHDIEHPAKPWPARLRTHTARLLRRREFLAGAASASILASAAGPRPNIVVVLMDDLRWDELHCTGHPFALTPNIDRLAAEGAIFRNAFVTSPLCSPSRACFLTGQYAHAHGIADNTDHSPASHRLQTFPRALQANGYETAFIGKWHMGVDDTPRPGFDHWVGFPGQGTYFDPVLNVDGRHVKEKGYTTDILTQVRGGTARSSALESDLCLWLPHKAVHPEVTQYADGSVSDPNGGEFTPPNGTRSCSRGRRCRGGPTRASRPRANLRSNERSATCRRWGLPPAQTTKPSATGLEC